MWLICMKVQRSNLGIKVAGYMGEAGYTSDEYQARTTELRTWYGYPQSQKSSDLRPAIRSQNRASFSSFALTCPHSVRTIYHYHTKKTA